MASRGSSDGASNGEDLQPSSSSSSRDSSTTMGSNGHTEPTSLTIRVLQEITENFSQDRELGQGAYGKVYKGVRENGEEIAVKLLYNNLQAIDDKQFQREFDNLMMFCHENIVRLVGYCYETQRQHMDFEGRIVFGETTYRALCFEYMHRGSLQRHLSDESCGLDWQTRYKIIKGTCEGLKYLHEGFKEPIYHLDLKPDNILLDENMVPKLADFGLSKLFGEEQTRVTQSPTGTLGYMPPEYLFRHIVSKKSDIFSLGVVMTQIIAGPKGHTRSAEMPHQEFLDEVHLNWMNRLEKTCLSQQQLKAYCKQVSTCTQIGLSCMEFDREQRPCIADIINRLDETEYAIEKPRALNRPSKKERTDEDSLTIHHHIHTCPLARHEFGHFFCDYCYQEGQGPRYRCHNCDFDLHLACSTYSFPCHEHALTFRQRCSAWVQVSCNVCKTRVYDPHYGCGACKFVVHPTCALDRTIAPAPRNLFLLNKNKARRQGRQFWRQFSINS